MRSTLAMLLAVAVIAAGCLQTTDTSSSSTTSASGGSTGGNQGIAVGEPIPGGSGGAAVRPPSGHNDTQGLHIEGSADRSGTVPGGVIHFWYNVTNTGADARTEGFCGAPYSFTLRDGSGKEHPMTVPMMRCMAYSENPFPHQATYGFNTTWNGTYAEGDHLVKAPAGQYTLTATFIALRAGGNEAITLSLPVNVLSAAGQQ